MELGLRGRVALIAGGSKGIGRAIAHEMAAEGAMVAVVARNKAGLDDVADEIARHGGKAVPISADLTKTEEVTNTISRVVDAFGGLDILVNNIGDSKMGHDWSTSDEEWAAMIDQSLLSAVKCSRAAIPHLRRSRSGCIINIASVNGHQPPGGRGDYNAAKAGMLALSKTLSMELAPDITVNAVCPARIDTPLWHRMAHDLIPEQGSTVEEVLEKVGKQDVPMGRFGRPEDVAGVVVFLASQRARWITGVAYNVDGGYTKAMA
jgi:3-oxoacyl-[acyl-carrier protein] reductase